MIAPPTLVDHALVGDYELLRRIGRGGMAEVWVARRATPGRKSKYVAIKVIAAHLAGGERHSQMFRSEAELSSMLSHSNIVQVFDEGEDAAGRAYMVMEWVDGINLVRLRAALSQLDDEPTRVAIIAHVIGQLLHALAYAHAITTTDGHGLGLVHRDISPQNVLVSNAGDVKLADFGVAHHVFEESSGLHIKGKLRYMAPEQLAGHTREPTIDLFAVGAILHELLDGKKFRGDFDDERVMHAQVLGGHIPALQRPAPPALDALRLGLLQAEPRERIPSAQAALGMLGQFHGYRDMRTELGRLCGGLTGVFRPRTGPGFAEAAGHTPRPTPAPGRPDPTVALPDGGLPPVFEPTTTAGRALHDTAPSHAQVNFAAATTRPQRRWASLAALLLVAVVAIGAGFATATFWPRSSVDVASTDTDTPPQVAASIDPHPPSVRVAKSLQAPAKPPLPVVSIAPPIAAAPVTAPAALPPEVVEHEPAPQPKARPTRRKRKSKRTPPAPVAAGPRVKVHIRFDGVTPSPVKLGGHAFEVAPRSAGFVPIGAHRIYWKAHARSKWRRGPRVTLREGEEWRILVGADGPQITRL